MNPATDMQAPEVADDTAPIGPAGRVVPTYSGAVLYPSEAADHLGTTERTLEAWRQKKCGPPYVKVGAKSVRYPRDQLIEWLRNRTVAA